jgi:hypothetical protein
MLASFSGHRKPANSAAHQFETARPHTTSSRRFAGRSSHGRLASLAIRTGPASSVSGAEDGCSGHANRRVTGAVRRPGAARRPPAMVLGPDPTTRAVKVVKVGVVKQPWKHSSRPVTERGWAAGEHRRWLLGLGEPPMLVGLAPVGLDVEVDRIRDRLVSPTRLMLVDQRGALTVVTHTRHQGGAAGPASAPGSALGGRPAHAGPHVREDAQDGSYVTLAGAGGTVTFPWATLAPIALRGLRLRWGEFRVLDKGGHER